MNALRRPSTAVNALLALLIVGAGFWGRALLRDTSETTRASASGVRTVVATQGTVTRTVSADGAVASASTATATFTTAGTVTAIPVKVGQTVSAGTLLAKVDPTAAQRDLDLAEANLEAARDALDRAEDAGTDTDNASHAVTEAKLAVDEAEAAVAGTRLIAPMAGTVVAVNGSLGGSSAVTGDATKGFVDLADLTKLQITAAFSEADATELKAGQSATIVWNALQNAETTGEVVAVDPTATTENSVVTYGVTVSLPNPPDGAKPGQTVTVSVVTGSVEKAVMINSAAVTTAGNRHTVTVLDSAGRQEIRQVQVGLEGDDAAQITSGLASGERVVVPTSTTATTTTTNLRGGNGFPGGGGAPPGGGNGGR
ncbi:RND transporter [Actinoplanes philippinensis]|uniref:Membrane fusion protein, macrolide-specific efflux system n=1 Tax=Actinoplanes philippinensis TaxID=35752 RepID=A0A1I1ZM22_9ACTN|nr:efflux RND transporter periplasmic adaptor subunit [Actinoplanes philippinensis]GIE75407.1 RND transporter [Actinoplanes philippinensis]SFE32757.1 membrane fusion protein, macrolide-specific efflux system [Actinoplanes philippinensis]